MIHTSALRGKANFAGFAPTKAAQRILAEAMARELGPKFVHVAYVLIDAVIDLEWTRKRFADAPDGFFIKPSAVNGDAAKELIRFGVNPAGWTLEKVRIWTRSLGIPIPFCPI